MFVITKCLTKDQRSQEDCYAQKELNVVKGRAVQSNIFFKTLVGTLLVTSCSTTGLKVKHEGYYKHSLGYSITSAS